MSGCPRQGFEPIAVVLTECDVERQDVLDIMMMDGPVTYCGPGSDEAVEEGFGGLFACAFEVVAGSRGEGSAQVFPGFCDSLPAHLEDQMMFVAVTEGAHSRREVVWK